MSSENSNNNGLNIQKINVTLSHATYQRYQALVSELRQILQGLAKIDLPTLQCQPKCTIRDLYNYYSQIASYETQIKNNYSIYSTAVSMVNEIINTLRSEPNVPQNAFDILEKVKTAFSDLKSQYGQLLYVPHLVEGLKYLVEIQDIPPQPQPSCTNCTPSDLKDYYTQMVSYSEKVRRILIENETRLTNALITLESLQSQFPFLNDLIPRIQDSKNKTKADIKKMSAYPAYYANLADAYQALSALKPYTSQPPKPPSQNASLDQVAQYYQKLYEWFVNNQDTLKSNIKALKTAIKLFGDAMNLIKPVNEAGAQAIQKMINELESQKAELEKIAKINYERYLQNSQYYANLNSANSSLQNGNYSGAVNATENYYGKEPSPDNVQNPPNTYTPDNNNALWYIGGIASALSKLKRKQKQTT